jgi:hypothetical protein
MRTGRELNYQPGSDRDSPNHGSTVSSKRVMARIRPPIRAAALTPVMFIGASDSAFHRWLPIRAGEADCVAPIQVGAGQG